MTVLVAYALVALFCGLAIVAHPGWAFVGYYLGAFLRPNELSLNLYGVPLAMPLAAAALVGSVLWWFRKGYPRERAIQPIILLVMLGHFYLSAVLLESALAPVFGHERPVDSAALWRKFDIYLKMFLVIVIGSKALQSENWVHRILTTVGTAGAFLGGWANYHYFVLKTYPITGPGPAIGLGGGIFADRNDFCMFLSMSIIICWYLAFLTKRWWMRMVWLGTMPFLLHAILLTESRGGLLGAAIAFLYIAWRSKRRKLMFVGVTVGLAVALLFFTSDSLMARYGTISDYEQDASALSRLNTWRTGWRIMWGNPLFGVGLENFLEVFYDYSDYQPTWILKEGVWQIRADFDYEAFQARQAHNMWIQRGGETGVLGVLILLWFVVSIPVDSRRVRRWLVELKDIGKLDEARFRHALLLAYCIEGTLIPYLVTGFFLSMEDFEGLYVLGLVTACLTAWCRHLRAEAGLSSGVKRAPKQQATTELSAVHRPRPRWSAGAGS